MTFLRTKKRCHPIAEWQRLSLFTFVSVVVVDTEEWAAESEHLARCREDSGVDVARGVNPEPHHHEEAAKDAEQSGAA